MAKTKTEPEMKLTYICVKEDPVIRAKILDALLHKPTANKKSKKAALQRSADAVLRHDTTSDTVLVPSPHDAAKRRKRRTRVQVK
jgi:hypothetical protein